MPEKIEGLSIGLDLETLKIERGLTGLKDRLKTVNAEMKANLSAFDYGDKSINKYKTRLNGLNRKLEVQKQVTRSAKDEYEKMVREHGEGSKQAEKAAREYTNQVAALNNLERAVERTTNDLSEMREQQRIAESGWTKFGERLEATGSRITAVGDKLKSVGQKLSLAITAPLTGMAFASNRSFYEIDEGLDNVIKATGATGEALDSLKGSFKNVYGRFPTESAALGSALGEVNTRFAFTDKKLEDSTEKFMKFADITGLDATQSVQLVARAMGDAGIEADDFESVLDSVAKAAQATGVGADKLLESITKYGAPMRALGFDLAESSALFASWELAGVNAEIAMSGLKQSISRWGKEGKDPRKEFRKTLSEIEKAPDIAKATSLAIEAFGAKAGPDLADAIQGGRFEFEALLKSLEGSAGTVDQTYESTVSGSEKFQVAMQNMKLVGADLWELVETQLAPVMDGLVKKLQKGVEWFNGLSDKTKTSGIIFAGFAAALGPAITFLGIFIGSLGNILKAFKPVTASIARAGGLLKWLRLGFAALTGPIGITIGILTVLGAGFIGLYQNSDAFRTGIHNLIAKIKELAKEALKALQPAIAAVIKFFKDQLVVIQKFWKENKDTIMDALNNVYKFIKFIFEKGILPVIKFVMPLILLIIKSVWGNIQGVIKGALNIIMGAIKIFSGLFTGDFSKMWEGVKQLFKGGIEFAWNLLNLMFIGRLLKGIGGFVKSFGSSLKSGWDNAIGGIKTFVGKAKDWFKSFVDDGLKKFDDLVAGAKALPGKIGAGIKNMAGKVSEGVKSVANKMAEGLGKGVNGVIGGVNFVLENVGLKTRIVEWKVPQYAKGTDNHPGGPAVVGEKGRELAHVPGVGYTMLGEKGAQFLTLPKGTSVLPNKETEDLLKGFFPGYEKGTGWLSGAWNSTKKTASKIKDKALDVWSYISDPSKLFNKVLEKFGVETPSFPGILKGIGTGGFDKIKEALKGFLKEKIEGFGDVPAAGSGVKRWAGVASRALMMTGQFTKANLDRLLYQMQTESGGNPRAINLWDINAKRGIPSKGLMQVIDPTFRAYAMPGFNQNIYDPLSNILASIRYAVSRYGSLSKAYRGVGYASGGLINSEGLYQLAEGGWPEWVIPTDPSRRTDAMKLLALAGKDIAGNKRPGQLPNVGSNNDDTILKDLLDATLQQNQILMKILQKDERYQGAGIDFRTLAQLLRKPLEEVMEFHNNRFSEGRMY